MVGSSVLPACLYNGQLMFLFGKENSLADTPGWADFGGGVETGEPIFGTAMREGAEELTGFLGGPKEMRSLIRRRGGVFKMVHDTYHIHLFCLPYEEYADMPLYYNHNHRFLWQRMNKQMLNRTRLFEKSEIRWFSVNELRRRKREFRNFYQKIIEETILPQCAAIEAFLKRRHPSSTRSHRKRQSRHHQTGLSRRRRHRRQSSTSVSSMLSSSV